MSLSAIAEIRGMGFRPPAKAIIESLKTGAPLELVREPSNEYDPNAVQVWVKPQAVSDDCRAELEQKLAGYGKTLEDFDEPPGWFLGYVGKEWARELSPELKREGVSYKAIISFSGAGKPQCEVEVE